MADSARRAEKKQIYYARTYRHWRMGRLTTALYLLLFVLPCVVLLFFTYDELTYIMCRGAEWVLEKAGYAVEWESSIFLPHLGSIYSLTLPTKLPSYGLILANLAVCLALIWALTSLPRGMRPISIYLSIVLFTHVISCAFFLLGRDIFPYSVADFSDLYIKQQIGIWLTFLILMGLIMGFLASGGVVRRILTVLAVMLYSFAFGFVRYTLFLWILAEFSMLYMPLMFFVLGPFFDFLYFVAIYAMSTNRMIHNFETSRRGEWEWA